ncbi:hypothetical protein B0H14DRAFT_1465593 [Mycena olivaceomarginata]|nr:hypothetical protein B0H14DRAFT_1465593 [Mycena olivaceomarginata]
MAPASSSAERIRLNDSLNPTPPSRRPAQTARKSTGGNPPRKMLEMELEGSSSIRSSSLGPTRDSTRSEDAPFKSAKMPIRTQRLRKSPISHQTGNLESLNSSPSNGRRTSQTARKSTGRRAPPKVSAESSESSSAAHNTPSPIVFTHTPEPAVSCNLCPSPLQMAQSPAVEPSQPIQDLLTVCKHHFHYACYMRHLTISPIDSRGYCPTCQASLLTKKRYWVHVTTNSGSQCYTDITDDVEEQFLAVRRARQQIFFDSLSIRNLTIAATLLAGPDSVDVNFRTPLGGRSPLHFCAMNNDVDGISFLLSHGANKNQTADDGLLAIDYARSCNALNAVEWLS